MTEVTGSTLIADCTIILMSVAVGLTISEELVVTESGAGPKLFGSERRLNVVVGSDEDRAVVVVGVVDDVGYRTSAIGFRETESKFM